jgi:hypothetical protein
MDIERHGPQDWALSLTLCMQPLNRDLYKSGQEDRARQLVIGNWRWQWAVGSVGSDILTTIRS